MLLENKEFNGLCPYPRTHNIDKVSLYMIQLSHQNQGTTLSKYIATLLYMTNSS
jgi:hypothetical protein